MEVVLDSNIIIGAAITPKGPPGRIISAWRASAFVLVTSPALLTEIGRAFTYPKVQRYLAWDAAEVAEFLDLLRRTAVVVEPTVRVSVVDRDADDNRVLEAAVAGSAQYVVTNDDALLELKTYEGIEIVTAARFAAILSL